MLKVNHFATKILIDSIPVPESFSKDLASGKQIQALSKWRRHLPDSQREVNTCNHGNSELKSAKIDFRSAAHIWGLS